MKFSVFILFGFSLFSCGQHPSRQVAALKKSKSCKETLKVSLEGSSHFDLNDMKRKIAGLSEVKSNAFFKREVLDQYSLSDDLEWAQIALALIKKQNPHYSDERVVTQFKILRELCLS